MVEILAGRCLAAFSELHRKRSVLWFEQCWFISDIGKLLLACFQVFCTLYLYVRFNIKPSDIGKCLRFSAGCPPSETDAFCLAYTHVFYPLVSVGSSATESMSTVFRLGRMENDVVPYFPVNPFSFCLMYCYLSLSLFISLSISEWESSCFLIAEWISEWKHLKRCFPMWCRLTSIQACIVKSIYCITEGTCNHRRVPSKAYQCLLVS